MVRCCLIAVCIALGVAAPAPAEDERPAGIEFPGESLRAARRLAAADQLAAEAKWSEAIDAYQHLLAEAGEELVPLDPRHDVPVRRLCHVRLAALPPPALRLYRARVDSQARKWLEQGMANRDPGPLRRLALEAFCSRFTDRALDLLGDLAFERGRFEEALSWWRMLARPASAAGVRGPGQRDLVFPDPQNDVARVRAKQLLALLFQGERYRWQEELQAFTELHGKAEGALAGHRGNYAAILQALAHDAETLAAPPGAEAWPTFAGDPSRQRVLAQATGRLARLPQAEGPQWMVRLKDGERVHETEDDADAEARPLANLRGRRPATYPVIVGGQVLVADAQTVSGYDLRTGQRILHYDLLDHPPGGELLLGLQGVADPDLRSTLTATEERVYARLGTPSLGPRKGGSSDTFLVCLNLQAHAAGDLERWKVKSQAPDGGPAAFEGAPVYDRGRVYIALTRFAGLQTITAIACYDAETSALRWQRDVCSTPELPDGERRYRHHLLTVAGPNLAYCSHSGAIVALDAASGRWAWAVRYPSRGVKAAEDRPSPRDLAPCLYAGGRLFVAPLDYSRIFCLDPATGEQLWESRPVEVIHLLGVTRGRLIFTAVILDNPQPLYSLRALEAATGTFLRDWFWPNTGASLAPAGHGLLAGDRVFWPTAHGLYALDAAGQEVLDAAPRIQGNLAAAGGCLVTAGHQDLAAYIPDGLLLEQRRREAAAAPQAALARYRLGLAEADVGMLAPALADLARAEELAGSGEKWHGVPLRQRAHRRRHQVLLDAAEKARAAGRWDEADAFLARAAGRVFAPAERLGALARRAALGTEAGRPARAVAAWQSILDDPALAGDFLVTANRVPQPAALWAAEQIDGLLRTHGRSAYEAIEEQARKLLASARAAERKEVLGRLGREFPNAAVTGPALLELARLEEQAGNDGAVAQAYREVLRRPGAETNRALALAGLARAYEREECWSAARLAWQRLVSEAGERVVAGLHPECRVRDGVVRQPHRSADGRADACTLPGPALPLARSWEAAAGDGERLLAPIAGPEGATDRKYLLGVRGTVLTCWNAITGQTCWRRTLASAPLWAGRHADMVIVAGAGRIHGLRLADGKAVWSWSGAEGCHLDAFRLAGGRLFFREDERRLDALDAASGKVLWTRWAPGAQLALPYPAGRFHLPYYAGEEGLVVQTTGGRLLVLDSRTGQTRSEADTQQPWPRPPLPLDERRVLLVTDPEHLVLRDLTTGAALWVHAMEAPVSLTGEAPHILGNRTALLVLVPRNYGFFLESLDPLTGRSRWPQPLFLGIDPADLQTGALDETAAYWARKDALEARALADGRLLWRQPLPLPAAHWRVIRTRGYLVAYPWDRDALQVRFRWLGGTADFQLSLPRQTGPGRYFPVLICDANTGELVERLNFPAAAPRLRVRMPAVPSWTLLPFVRQDQLSAEEPDLALCLCERGLAVVHDGKAWGLTAAPGK